MDRSSRFIPAIEFCGVRLLPTFPVARLLFRRILFTRSCMMVSSILDGEFDRRQSFNLGPSPRERHLRILPFTLEVGLSRQLPQSEHIPWCGMRTKHSVSENISDALFSRPGRSTSFFFFFFFLNQFISRYLLHPHTLDKDCPSTIYLKVKAGSKLRKPEKKGNSIQPAKPETSPEARYSRRGKRSVTLSTSVLSTHTVNLTHGWDRKPPDATK